MNFDLNPLNVLKERKVAYMPPHFSKTALPGILFMEDEILDWVTSKLKGRFCFTKLPVLDSNNKLQPGPIIGFEDTKEMTYFLLACPHIRRQ
jgi:hypothetical protein